MTKGNRKSNIELYRIIIMMAIVAHHYVVNSGLLSVKGPIFSNIRNWRSVFLLLFGAWGKTGINCFVLITGYYMCKSNITLRKYIKLLSEVLFYKIIISVIFIIAGYEIVPIFDTVINCIPITSIHQNFLGSYLVFFLSIPFINILINYMNKNQYRKLLALLGFVYIFLGSLKTRYTGISMNYFSWFIVIYLIGAYIRLYQSDFRKFENKWGIISMISILVSCISVIIGAWIIGIPYYFVSDSNAVLAVVTSICLFMYFLNHHVAYSKTINTIASTTFGVLLIHAHSDTMRHWLWVDVFDSVGTYSKSMMPLRVISSVLIVFFVSSFIDLIRQKLLEKPFMDMVDRKISF